MPCCSSQEDTTPQILALRQEQAVPALTDQQTFQHYLHELAGSAICVVFGGDVWGTRCPDWSGLGRKRRQAQRVLQWLL